MTKIDKIFEECLSQVDPKIKAEVRAKADAYIGHKQEIDEDIDITACREAYINGYLKAKSELGWHEYPADPPEKSGAYLVAFKGINGDIYKYMAYYHKDCGFEGEPLDNIIAWMPQPEYQPKEKLV